MANDETSLKQVFQGMYPTGPSIIRGKVLSVSPLKIQGESDNKLMLGQQVLIVPKHLTDHVVSVSLQSGQVSGATDLATVDGDTHNHALTAFALQNAEMTIKNGLQVGESVHLLALNNSKQYFVLGRVTA